jgi:purine-binding chemotaxis protein CheW
MEQVHLLTFRLDQQAYAFSIDEVFQIIDMVAILPIPKAEPFFEGVINLHGRMIPVINLHRFMADSSGAIGLHTPILLVRLEDQITGLIVDEVLDVHSMPANQVERPADFLPAGIRSIPILKGLTTAGKKTVIVLDLNHLLDVDQARALGQMTTLLQNFYKPAEAAAGDE